MAAPIKFNPPTLTDGGNYEQWRKQIEAWREITSLEKKKQALAVYISLTGRAAVVTSELEIADLKTDGGLKLLLEKLDSLFLVDKGRRQFTAFRDLYSLRRNPEVSVRQFVVDFEHLYYNFSKLNMNLPDVVEAFMLLACCNLSDKDEQLVMSTVGEVSYKNMMSALNRIFGEGMPGASNDGLTASASIKSEPVFLTDESTRLSSVEATWFVRNGNRVRGRPLYRGITSRGKSRAVNRTRFATRGAIGAMRRQNPRGPDGEVTRCVICESIYHWARNCPHAYENAERDLPSESVDLNLFMGYTGDKDGHCKLQNLVEEAKGCAVLDSGCSTSVCGTKWLDEFCSGLSEFERAGLVEMKSKATFTFADGVTVPSLKRVTLPCNIGNMGAKVTTDVVECNIPLLMSKAAMKRGGMILNFATDQVNVSGVTVNLRSTRSGHYLLPL